MTDPTPLSPAAAAVLDAVTLKRWDVPHQACPKSIDQIKSDVAAALREAANQVVPLPRIPYDSCCDISAAAIRADLLAIAAELDGGAQ